MRALIDLLNDEKELINMISGYEQSLVFKLHEKESASSEVKQEELREEIKDLRIDITVGKKSLEQCRKNIRLYLLNLFKE